jgi:ribosomal protein L20
MCKAKEYHFLDRKLKKYLLTTLFISKISIFISQAQYWLISSPIFLCMGLKLKRKRALRKLGIFDIFL